MTVSGSPGQRRSKPAGMIAAGGLSIGAGFLVILGYAEEREQGKVFYEVETKVKGLTRDLLFDAAGALVAVEQEMTPEAVPAAVQAAFNALGKVLKVESITKGSTVTYEAHIQKKDGKKSEVVVDAQGKVIEHNRDRHGMRRATPRRTAVPTTT